MDPEEQTDAPISDNIDPSHPVNVGDLQVFAEEVAAFVGRKIAEIPTPEVTLATKIDALETKLDSLLAMVSAQPKARAIGGYCQADRCDDGAENDCH
jgi:hypothetical protein